MMARKNYSTYATFIEQVNQGTMKVCIEHMFVGFGLYQKIGNWKSITPNDSPEILQRGSQTHITRWQRATIASLFAVPPLPVKVKVRCDIVSVYNRAKRIFVNFTYVMYRPGCP